MAKLKVPRATTKRLPIYYRYLNILHDQNVTHVSSGKFAKAVQIDPATIRRDFSYFGALGKRGYGYDINQLLRFFKKILHQDNLVNVALIGVGNFGHALLNFNFHQGSNVRIAAAFDVKPQIINTVQSGVPVYSMKNLVTQLRDQQIDVVIMTVPAKAAQKVCNQAIKGGAKGILNFTPVRLASPANVRIQNVDLTNELQTLIYFVKHYK
ncbi:MAG: redox-sensing transcriptional repressor Rex [Acetilactobacillus jinshanensis]